MVNNLGGSKISDAKHERVYLATHTLDDGIAPGNFLLNKDRSFRVKAGDTIEVAGKKFTITKTERAGKGLVTQDEQLWDKSKPGLVLLLCVTDSNDNGIVYAEPAW